MIFRNVTLLRDSNNKKSARMNYIPNHSEFHPSSSPTSRSSGKRQKRLGDYPADTTARNTVVNGTRRCWRCVGTDNIASPID